MLKRFSALTALFLFTTSATAQGTINASGSARQLNNEADDDISGSYVVRNVATGQVLEWDGSQSLYPGSRGASLQVYQHGRENWVRVSTPNMKCLSAQWGGSYDHAGVLYACAVGPNNSGGGLEKAKQWWLLVPADGGKNVAVKEAARKPPARKQPARKPVTQPKKKTNRNTRQRAATQRKAASRKTTTRNSRNSRRPRRDLAPLPLSHTHLPTLPVVETAVHVDLSQEAVDLNDLTKRQKSGATYYIIATDHINDMATRALAGSRKNAGSEVGTILNVFRRGDRSQMWTFTRA